MRVLIAPDKFAGTLTAVEAAAAIEVGWRRRDPDAEVYLAPMADGGPGFLDVLSSVVDGSLLSVTVRGPLGEPVPATVLIAGETAYVESAQACGLHLVPAGQRRPEEASTYGVGELVVAAVDGGARRIVLGLGGSGTNDAGAGLLAALGATPADRLERGAAGLKDLTEVDLGAARTRLEGVRLVAASDVDNPLLGLRGATNVFGGQKGIAEDRRPEVDGWLARFAELAGPTIANARGAGAAGGLGYSLLLLGAELVSGIDLVAGLTHLRAAAAKVDLVLTGEGAFDFQSRDGKVISGVAKVANDAMRPCVVLAGKVMLGAREMRTMGVESAYALVDLVGEERAFGDPAGALADLAERVARTWAR
jgi:glycerate kinase